MSEMSMIEKVARALFAFDEVRWPSDCGAPEGDLLSWEENVQKDEYLDMARAAIEAMREPDEAMCAAPGIGGVSAGDYNMAAFEAEAAWRSMIDEALRPSETQSAGDA